MTAEQILMELLDKLKSEIRNSDVYIAQMEAFNDGYAEDILYNTREINQRHIEWIEEKIEIKKSVIIKENK
tara:strand:+ start:3236 stop:3448 length:213 start_codon:yes stop_codon:yes gene_type:complete